MPMKKADTRSADSRAFAVRLRKWRRMNTIKQAGLAEMVGVSQATIARWEQGLSVPSEVHMRQLQDLMMRAMRDDLLLDRLFIKRQSAVRAVFNFDGGRLLTVSDGFRSLWPATSELMNRSLVDYLVNEMENLYCDNTVNYDIRTGSLGLVTCVSDRNLNLPLDSAIRHRWHICFRHQGARILVDTVFEPCEPDVPVGVKDLVYMEDLTDL